MLETLMIRYMYKVYKKNLDSTISAVEAKILKILGFQNGGKRVAPVGQECRIMALVGARASHLQHLKKQIFIYLNIKLSHSMNGSNVWGSLAPYGDVLPFFVQMEYLATRQEVFFFRNCHN